MNDASRPDRPTSTETGLRLLDLLISALGYALAGSLLAVPWALYRGGDAIWFREGQFVAGLALVAAGVFLLRPNRRNLYRVTESGSHRENSGHDEAGGSDAGADPTRSPEAGEPSEPPPHLRVLADLLNTPALTSVARIARGWRLLLAGALLFVLSLGPEVATST